MEGMDRDENQTDPWTSVVPFNFPDFFLVFYHFYIHYYSYICVNLFFQLFFHTNISHRINDEIFSINDLDNESFLYKLLHKFSIRFYFILFLFFFVLFYLRLLFLFFLFNICFLKQARLATSSTQRMHLYIEYRTELIYTQIDVHCARFEQAREEIEKMIILTTISREWDRRIEKKNGDVDVTVEVSLSHFSTFLLRGTMIQVHHGGMG